MLQKNYIKEIGNSLLKVEFHVTKGTRYTDKGMTVHFPDFIQQSFFKIDENPLSKLFIYCSNKLHYQQLTEGKSIIEKLKTLNLLTVKEDDFVLIDGYKDNQSAIVFPLIHQQSGEKAKVEIKPMVYFPTIAVHGFTVAPGYFCDFIMVENDKKQLKGYTVHFEEHHFGIVILMLELFCEIIYSYIQNGQLPTDYEEFSHTDYPSTDVHYLNVKEDIYSYIEMQVNRNSSVQLSAIKENGCSIQEWVKKYRSISNLLSVHAPILKIALTLGTPPSQVIQYMENN